MSTQEVAVTRDMVKAITKGAINRILVPALLFTVTIIGAGGVWVGSIQTTVKSHEYYKVANEPLKLEMHQAQAALIESIDNLTKTVDRIEQAQIKHIDDFQDYKDNTR